MTDKLSKEKRSWNMSRIRNKDTSIEIKVRKHLYSKGFRYRKNVNSLPGKPDIVLSKYKTVIFVHGCFWHRHPGCSNAATPSARKEFWQKKFQRTVEIDRLNQSDLEDAGWQVITLWECDIEKHFEITMEAVLKQLGS